MVNDTVIRNFFYTSTPEHEGVLFHIPSGRFFRVFDEKCKSDFRQIFEIGSLSEDVLEMLHKIDSGKGVCSVSCENCDNQIKSANEFTVRKLALVLTSSCNMRCRYCYANYGMYDYEKAADMNAEKLESVLSYFTKNFKGIGAIQFFGGEPTLKEDLIYQTVDYFERMVQSGEIKTMPVFGIVTNGVYMPDKLVDYFKKYSFFVTVSLDGPILVNDTLRIDCSGHGKYKSIWANIAKIQNAGINGLSFECTYTAEHIRNSIFLVDLIKFFDKEFNNPVVHIAPVNIDNNHYLSLVPYKDKYNQYMEELVDYTFDMLLEEKKMCSTNIVLGVITRIISQASQKAICPAGVNTFSVSHDNKISPCFMYTSKDDISYGNIGDDPDEILSRAYTFDEYINNKDKVDECQECFARNVCSSCLGSFEIKSDKVQISNPIYCESIKVATKRALQRLSDIKKNPKTWEEFNRFLDKGYEERR